jgi:hypothetical protein
MVTNQEATIELDESQTTVSYHPPEETVEYVTGWPEWYSETQSGDAGTSSQPPPSMKKHK